MNYIDLLFIEIKKALKKDEVPVSALIINNETGDVISKAYNSREKTHLTLNHAEIKCITKANKRLKNKNLSNCSLFVTLEPCDMCKTIIKEARIQNVYYLLERSKFKKQYFKTNFQNWSVDEKKCEEYRQILSNFFKKRR